MIERYKKFVEETNFFENHCRVIVQCFQAWKGNQAHLEKVDFNEGSVTITYYYPTGDYENIDVEIPINDFLSKSASDIARDIEAKQKRDQEEQAQKRQEEYERGQRAELKRLQAMYPNA